MGKRFDGPKPSTKRGGCIALKSQNKKRINPAWVKAGKTGVTLWIWNEDSLRPITSGPPPFKPSDYKHKIK
jgi:hypothetical protein